MTSLAIGSVVILLFLIGFLFIQLNPAFGGKLDPNQKASYSAAPNYREGKFINQIPTPMKMSWNVIKSLIRDYIKGNPNGRPEKPFPVIALDSLEMANNKKAGTRISWFGHSTFFLKMEGLNILIDPMFGNTPAPHPLLGAKRFTPNLPIKPEALPAIDVVIFSHDHYDHLDYGSVMKLKDKVAKFYMPLGLGAHLKAWGVSTDKIHELNWGDSISYRNVDFICTPARHFSGRGLFDRDATLWSSWVIRSSQKNLFFSGDSGYGPHFKNIGEQYGPFDFAMLECGQYDKRWENIHMMPEQTVMAAQDVNAKLMMPIHWGAFKLALHDWNDPVKKVTSTAEKLGVPIITPKIGETIILDGSPILTNNWWENY